MTTSLEHAPKVGDGATQHVGSDSYPFTIVSVSASGKTLTLQRDHYARIDSNGQSETQLYRYEANPNAPLYTARWSEKRQRFVMTGSGSPLSVGFRRAYQDPSF